MSSPLNERKLNVNNIILSRFKDGETFDLAPHLVEAVISEDIYSKYCKGSILIGDASGIRSFLPIVGEEFITFVLQMPGSDDVIKYTFIVDSVTKLNKAKMNMESLSINFVKLDYYDGLFKSFSTSFKNTKINEIVSTLYENEMEFEFDKIDETEGNLDLIIPNLSANETMNFLLKRSINSDQIADFVFFQNLEGKFNFRSLKSLQNEEIKHDFIYREKSIDINSEQFVPNVISEAYKSLRINSENIAKGSYGNLVQKVNPIDKFIETDNFKMSESIGSFGKFNDGNLFSDEWNEYISQSTYKKYHIRTGQKDKIDKWINTRNSKSSLMSNIVGSVRLEGNLLYKAGQVINYDRPPTSFQNSLSDDKVDALLSGKYLMTSVMHKFKADGTYITDVEIVTDSLYSKI